MRLVNIQFCLWSDVKKSSFLLIFFNFPLKSRANFIIFIQVKFDAEFASQNINKLSQEGKNSCSSVRQQRSWNCWPIWNPAKINALQTIIVCKIGFSILRESAPNTQLNQKALGLKSAPLC